MEVVFRHAQFFSFEYQISVVLELLADSWGKASDVFVDVSWNISPSKTPIEAENGINMKSELSALAPILLWGLGPPISSLKG